MKKLKIYKLLILILPKINFPIIFLSNSSYFSTLINFTNDLTNHGYNVEQAILTLHVIPSGGLIAFS